jgi:acyl-coenzyme A thioesterase PaaI-like protein
MTNPATAAPYPPDGHSISDLDITTEQLSATRARSLSPVTDAVRNEAGAAGLGYLVSLVDVNAALVALRAAHPDWTATADLALHEARPLARGPAVVESHLVRAGSKLVVIGTDIYDGAGIADLADAGDPVSLAHVATGLATFARVPGTASEVSGTFDPLGTVGQRRRIVSTGALPTEPLLERCGLRVIDAAAGVVELANSPYVANSMGAINGGVLGIIFQGAAEAAVPGFVATDLQIHYLAQARTGPARTRAVVVRETNDHVVCRVEAVDAGDDGRVLALATVTLQRIARYSHS